MSKKFYFQCTSNPQGPLLVLDNYWEAKDMKLHPDYVEVDEDGLPVINTDESDAPARIASCSGTKARTPWPGWRVTVPRSRSAAQRCRPSPAASIMAA